MSSSPAFTTAVTAALSFALAAAIALPAGAQTTATPPATKPAAKAVAKAPAVRTVKKSPTVEVIVPDATPDQVSAAEMVYTGRYECEFSQNIEIVQSVKYSAYVDVKAKQGGWLMKPVLSSTGAIRLEDVRGETLMVQIASKSMLLNVKTGHRIVDDCVSPKQRELIQAAKAAKEAASASASS